MDQKEFLALKIPFVKDDTLKQGQQGQGSLSIIGVLDASGSMSNCWEWLANFWNECMPKTNLTTITFDSRPRICQENVLSPKIRNHGGGGTEIVPAFEMMEIEIEKVPIQNNLTIIFISDGQDNNVRTIETRMQKLKGNPQNRSINFICLGVESGFPTSISMSLRQLYHRGDPQIPAIYLIEHASEQAFFNKFESMKKYFYPSKMVKLDKLVNLFPFDEEVVDEVYEGQWIITKNQKVAIISDSDPVILEAIPESKLEIDDIVDLFRSWVQQLQIQGMQKKENAKDQASDALLIMQRMAARLSQQFKMDVFHFNAEEINDPTQPFNVRAQRNYVYKYANKLFYFVEETKQLAKGVDPKQMNDFEAAKKLNIGTITGKHQQKALALKGITVEEFRIMRDEFQQIVINCKFKAINEQGQERSVVSLENQRDILSDSKLIEEGLKYVKSQYDFAETFPLIGHGLKVKRQDGCYVNPWIIQVENIAQQNKVIDSAYLVKNNFKVELNTGGDKKEEINCILPLFHETDIDLQPILRSRVIKLLMTFMVQQNVDTLYEDAYLALLSNSLIFLFKQPESKWKDETLNLIYQTTKIVYQGTEKFELYLQKLLQDPQTAYLIKEEQYEDYVATSKPFIHLFYAASANIIKDFETEVEKLIIYYFIREQYKHNFNINYYLKMKLNKQNEDQLQENFKANFEKFVSLKHFRESISTELKEAIVNQFNNQKADISLIEDKVFNTDHKLTLDAIEKFYEHFLGKKFDKPRYIHLIYHSLTTPQEQIFTQKVVYDNLNVIQGKLYTENQQNLTKGQAKYTNQLEKQYLVYFFKQHMMVKPMTYEHLKQECEAKKIDITTIAYNVKSGLSSNCCFSSKCPFYLQVLGLDYKRHIQTWGKRVPQGFHQTVVNWLKQNKSLEEIVKLATEKWTKFPKMYLGNEEIVHKYINCIAEGIPKEDQPELPQGQLQHSQVKLTFPKKIKKKKGYLGKHPRVMPQRGGRGGRGGRGRGVGGRGGRGGRGRGH